MNEFLAMQVVHSLGNLGKEELRLALSEFFFGFYVLEQFASLAVLHNKDHLHLGKREAVLYLHDVLVP